MAVEGTALRKRQQIANANRAMFMWVAGVSVVVGIAAVVSLFLIQKALFNEKVLAEKSKTAAMLVANNAVVDDLQDQVRVLNTNDSLKRLMISGETQPVQVVLDALPSEANSSAFGASLQQKFLQAPGIQLDSLNVVPVQDVEVTTGSGGVLPANTVAGTTAEQISFSFDVSTEAGNVSVLKDLLVNIERSIRPIDLTSVSIEAQSNRLLLKVEGHTYYQPARTVDLKDKMVKP